MSEPRTRYARTGDMHIAYQVLGEGSLDIVVVPGFVSHLEVQWQSNAHRRFIESLSAGARVIRFDKRGTGLSDPVAVPPTLEQRVRDLGAALDAVGSEHTVLFGYSEGGPTAIRFAVEHPDRTKALILYGTSARPPPLWYRNRFRTLIARWGEGASLDMFAPSVAASESQRAAAGAFERAGASPAMATALLEALIETDVRELLPQISVPTLVLHRERDLISVDEARYVVRRIPEARYVELPGQDHLPWIGDTGTVVRAVQDFLAAVSSGTPSAPATAPAGGSRRDARGNGAESPSGWAELTPAERVVSTLVAEGLSNPAIAERLFISRHTVEAHLKHIFVKLGIRSRAELAALAARESEKDP